MKSLFTLLLGAFAVTSFGQGLNESFESGAFSDDWKVINTNDSYKWEVVAYAEENDLSRSISGFKSGGEFAVVSTTGYKKESESPDQWLISPALTVESGDVLNFMMGCNSAYNGNAYVDAANKVKFEVAVSVTGAEPDDFTQVLLSLTPEKVWNWSNYSLSLDAFAGKQVYIAFHDYGNTGDSPLLTNALYMDNIVVNKERVSDLQVTAVTNPVPSCATEQPVTAVILNKGFDCHSYTVNYSIDGGEPVTETVDTPIEGGVSVTYTFSTEALLTSGSTHEVKVWAEALTDSNHDNDTIASKVEIGDEIIFPFIMTDDNAATVFCSSATKKMGMYTLGWQYYNDDNMKGWVYNAGIESYLLSDCILLPEGIVKLSFDYMALSAVELNVYLVTEPGKYEYLAGSTGLPAAEGYTNEAMTIVVPEDDVYVLGITPSADYVGSFYLNNINVSEASDDVEIVSIDSPVMNATLAKSGVTVSASFKNLSSRTLENVPVCFQLDGGDVVSETIGSMTPGAVVEHSFSSGNLDLSVLGRHELKVWADLNIDPNRGNDTIMHAIQSYEAYDFPFSASFEANESNADWIMYNAGGDILYWTIEQVVDGNVNYAKDGTHAAYMNSAAGMEHDDWLISPAIKASKGNARISFYYTTRMSSGSGDVGCNIKVYLASTDNPERIIEGEPVTAVTLTDANVYNYKQGYAFVEIPADGTYYLAFYNDGMGHDIILDDVRFDREEDLVIISASNSSISGFNQKENEVTVEIGNHGVTTRHDIKVAYSVNGGSLVEEVVSGDIAPGKSLEYTFKKKVDVSVPATYMVTVNVTDPDDADAFNNSWALPGFTVYANAQLPYEEDFEMEERRNQWHVEGGWVIAANMSTSQSSYNGKGGLYHTGAAGANGDWAYSGCIEIPAGTYDFSFFYRTFMNMTDAERYGQNFSIYLGKEQTPEAMTLPVYSADKAVVATKAYEKVLQQIEIAESGNYYIGIKCTTASTWGTLYIDMITLESPVTDGLELGLYQSDFVENIEDCYRYNPADNFVKWQYGKGVDWEECLTASRTSYFYSDIPTELPGLIVLPAFKLKGGEVINASLDYRIMVDNIDDLTDEDKDRIKIGVYLAEKNLPQAFTTEMAVGSVVSENKETATGEITVPADGIYYIGVLADGPLSAISGTVVTSYELYSIKLWNGNIGVNDVNEGRMFVYNDNTVRMLCDYDYMTVYAVDGTFMGSYSDASEISLSGLPKGLYVVSVKAGNRLVTEKLVVD